MLTTRCQCGIFWYKTVPNLRTSHQESLTVDCWESVPPSGGYCQQSGERRPGRLVTRTIGPRFSAVIQRHYGDLEDDTRPIGTPFPSSSPDITRVTTNDWNVFTGTKLRIWRSAANNSETVGWTFVRIDENAQISDMQCLVANSERSLVVLTLKHNYCNMIIHCNDNGNDFYSIL